MKLIDVLKGKRRRDHRHRYEWVDNVTEQSLATGIPLTVAKVYRCRKCGHEYREATEAGYQQDYHRQLQEQGVDVRMRW